MTLNPRLKKAIIGIQAKKKKKKKKYNSHLKKKITLAVILTLL